MKRNRSLLALMLMLLLFAMGSFSEAQEDARHTPLPEFELVADVWPSQEGLYPIRIAIRNLGFDDISSEKCLSILMRCVLHISNPDGSSSSTRPGGWRGRAPDDIQRGELASHCVNTPIERMFDMDQSGRYLVWWTDGNRKSNVMVFQKDEAGLRRLP